MFVLVIGGGKVGYYLAKELLGSGHEVVLMEKDRARAGQIAQSCGTHATNSKAPLTGGDLIPWALYGTCKSIGPNKEFKDAPSDARPWSAQIETQCLSKLADVQKRTAEKLAEPGKIKFVQQRSRPLERLVDAKDAGYLDEFVLYEVQSRMNPQATLTLTTEQRERVRLYVERFILGVMTQNSPSGLRVSTENLGCAWPASRSSP